MESIIGHKKQRNALTELYLTQKLPSALLFTGPVGVGKRLAAEQLARTVLCLQESPPQGGCDSCKSCALFDAGNSPDFYILQCKEKEEADTAHVKELLYSLNLRPYMGKNRVVILNNAEYLHPHSANALLKTLEEPRPGTYFILVTANPRRLPHTINSRCQSWFFPKLARQEVEQILKRKLGEHSAIDNDLLLLLDGSLEQMSQIQTRRDEYSGIKVNLEKIAAGDLVTAVECANVYAKNKEKLPDILHYARSYTHERMLSSAQKSSWAVALENIMTAEKLIFERNLAPATVLALLFINLARQDAFTTLTNNDTVLAELVV